MTKRFYLADKIALIILSITMFLSVIFFLPGGLLSGELLKGYLLIIGTSAAFIAWLVGRLIEAQFHFAWSPMFLGLAALVVAVFLSALFSPTPYLSFFGEGFDSGTCISILMFVLIFFLASQLFVSRRRVAAFTSGFFILYIVLALYQLAHLFFPTLTSFGIFSGRATTPVGLWSDFAYLSGAALVGCTLILEFLQQSKLFRFVIMCVGLLAFFFVVLANVLSVWMLVAASSFIILIYKLTQNKSSENPRFPITAFVLLLITLFLVLMNGVFGGFLAQALNARYVGIGLNLHATLTIARSSLDAHSIFGAGPNRFLHEWLQFRPAGSYSGALWNTPFSSGVSFFATLGLLTGTLGILACILFLFYFVFDGIRKTYLPKGSSKNFFAFSFFIIALYFILALLVDSPGISIIFCAFFFSGLFLSTLVQEKRIATRIVSFTKENRVSFLAAILVVVLTIIMMSIVSVATERFIADVYFQMGIRDANDGAYTIADLRLSQAITIRDLPSFERERVALAQAILQKTLSDSSLSSDQMQTDSSTIIGIGNTAALRAVSLDPSDPRNYLALADFMSTLAGLKVQNAFSSAETAYLSAIKGFPDYPEPYLGLAQLYFNAQDLKNAALYANEALEKKPDYTDAFLVLEKIDLSNNDSSSAIAVLKKAISLDQNNPDLYLDLGLAEYTTGDYADSVSALRTNVTENESSINGWYYLALADQKIGNMSEANTILNALHSKFPDNADISAALVGPAPSIPPPAPTEQQNVAKKHSVPVLPVAPKAVQ